MSLSFVSSLSHVWSCLDREKSRFLGNICLFNLLVFDPSSVYLGLIVGWHVAWLRLLITFVFCFVLMSWTCLGNVVEEVGMFLKFFLWKVLWRHVFEPSVWNIVWSIFENSAEHAFNVVCFMWLVGGRRWETCLLSLRKNNKPIKQWFPENGFGCFEKSLKRPCTLQPPVDERRVATATSCRKNGFPNHLMWKRGTASNVAKKCQSVIWISNPYLNNQGGPGTPAENTKHPTIYPWILITLNRR